jgi:hypothetical protein
MMMCENGLCCAAGWLLKEAKLCPDDGMIGRCAGVKIGGETVDAVSLIAERFGTTEQEVWGLISRNDSLEGEDRIDWFVEWCAAHGIEVEDAWV